MVGKQACPRVAHLSLVLEPELVAGPAACKLAAVVVHAPWTAECEWGTARVSLPALARAVPPDSATTVTHITAHHYHHYYSHSSLNTALTLKVGAFSSPYTIFIEMCEKSVITFNEYKVMLTTLMKLTCSSQQNLWTTCVMHTKKSGISIQSHILNANKLIYYIVLC